ncbi:hypothetical protein EAE96_003943 [Botrytis aclada]|nr:hypothetical protein EAE96_003943 [Botrytis aclada]
MGSQSSKIDEASATTESADALENATAAASEDAKLLMCMRDECAELLMYMNKNRVSDSEALFIAAVQRGEEVPGSDDRSETSSDDGTIFDERSPTPEPIKPTPVRTRPQNASPTEPTMVNWSTKMRPASVGQPTRLSQKTASPLEHDTGTRKRRAEDTKGATTAPLAKKPRQSKSNNARCPKAATAAAKIPMTAEEKEAARKIKVEEERQVYQPKAYKPRVRRELSVEFDPLGVPLPKEGLPAELAVTERRSRAPSMRPELKINLDLVLK